MTVPSARSAGIAAARAVAPNFVELTDAVLFGDVWQRPEAKEVFDERG